jgi:ABC-type Fe3+-hydroxamate transport system substrate-binding protein
MSRSERADTTDGAGRLSRRGVLRLGGGVVLSFAGGSARAADAARPRRVVVFDWGIAETLLALGAVPAALAETDGYREWVVEPPLPASVANLGLRIEPNFELIAALRPDLILITPELAPLRTALERIGQVETLSIYRSDGKAWDHAVETTRHLATLLGREIEADAFLHRVDRTIDEARAKLPPEERRPLYLVNFIDRRHVRIYGAGSIFQSVLDRLGLANAYTGWTSFWGFATLGIEHLAATPSARLLYLEPLPAETAKTFRESPLWQALPFVRERRVAALPPVWSFGGVASGERLASLLGETLGPKRTLMEGAT